MRSLLTLILFFLAVSVTGQTRKKPSKVFSKYESAQAVFAEAARLVRIARAKELKVGRQMPDINLGKLMNNKGDVFYNLDKKTKFSQFNDQLVILDFWNTLCKSCVQGFPKLSKLQEKYKGRIQVFLVNPGIEGTDNEHDLRKWLIKKNATPGKPDVVPENLPMIIEAEQLYKLFPSHGAIGYQVWLKNGKVILRGISQNAHEKKIEQALSDRAISYIEDEPSLLNGVPEPFFISHNAMQRDALAYSSSFGRFTDEAEPYGTGTADASGGEYIIDSLSKTRRLSSLNQSIFDLYHLALGKRFSGDFVVFGSRAKLEVDNEHLITLGKGDYSAYSEEVTDEMMRSYSFCYEQIVPFQIDADVRLQLMHQDLNRYFDGMLGLRCEIEKRKVSCYKILSLPEITKTQSNDTSYLFTLHRDESNRTIVDMKGGTLRESLRHYFSRASEQNGNLFDPTDIIVDFSGYKDKINLNLLHLSHLKSFEDLRSQLNQFGIDIVRSEEEVDMMVIKKSESKPYSL